MGIVAATMLSLTALMGCSTNGTGVMRIYASWEEEEHSEQGALRSNHWK